MSELSTARRSNNNQCALIRLIAISTLSLSSILLTGCGVTSDSPPAAETNATSEEYVLLTPEDRRVIATQICPRATVADVDLEMLQMSRDISSIDGQTNFDTVPFNNISENAATWDSIFQVLLDLKISSNLQSTLVSASDANSETVGLATDFLTSWERDNSGASGADEMIDLIQAQGVVALGQLEVNSICFDIAVLGE
jgi:hypothetical protein